MPPSTPPRKFAPTPIEQTTKSSRQPITPKEDKQKPRRFAPEPVEETTRSSKDARQPAEQEDKPKPRRFAPEPLEHTTKSTRDANQQPAEHSAKPKPRRFAPQVVEETHKSSKDKPEAEKRPHVKFQPEPVLTTYSTSRNVKPKKDVTDGDSQTRPPRKFTPILLDTAKRSRRVGDSHSGISQSHRTEYAYHLHVTEHWKRVTEEPKSGPSTDTESEEPQPAEPMELVDVASESDRSMSSGTDQSSQLTRQASPLDGSVPRRSACLTPSRTHSFRTPGLDTIESSESEPGSIPSPLSASPGLDGSPLTAPDDSAEFFQDATRKRESIDESFTHYLLEVERKKAQKRLEEQALAAYPNADFAYEHPDHYINNDDDSDDYEIEDRPTTWEGHEDDLMDMSRRESTQMSWEQQEAQRHAEDAERERRASRTTAKPTPSPFCKLGVETGPPDEELKSMRKGARPPMLGADLVFPRCPSPEPARFDVTQGSTALRDQMRYSRVVTDDERKRSSEDGGLWQVRQAEDESNGPLRSPIANNAKTSTHKGLWGGFCVDGGETGQPAGGLAPPPRPTGLMTPKNGAANPFGLASVEGRPIGVKTPPTPPVPLKDSDLEKLDTVLVTEQELDTMLEREFPDSFITQVYNYLSLGYPSLARPFDGELSKISHISLAELRQDDQRAKATPRGHIRLGPDFEGGGGEGMVEDGCMRWRALKLYVREWARQEKNMVDNDGVGGNWGTGARRGSWAI